MASNLEIVHIGKLEYSAGETVTLRLNRLDASIANGLRRVLLAEVPALAIDAVTVVQNSSVLPDEMIAHRLGLVPLQSDLCRGMNYARECPCQRTGCYECTVEGSLNVTCPDSKHSLEVFSNDLVFNNTNGGSADDDTEIRPVSSDVRGVWLLTLGRTQTINLRFVVRKGIAKVHAKFMPVATVSMRFSPDIVVNDAGLAKIEPRVRKYFVEACPRQVFEYDDSKQQVKLVNPDACIYCRECMTLEMPRNRKDRKLDGDGGEEEKAEAHDLPAPLAIVRPKMYPGEKYDFTFVIEGTGVLGAVQLLYDTLAVVKEKLTNVKLGLDRGSIVVPTRTIGNAPTAVRVVDEERLENRNPAADDLAMFLN